MSIEGLGGYDTDELRAAVRAVLRDVLPADLVRSAVPGLPPAVEHVTLRSDADLDALVRKVATLCEDATRRAALRDGRHGFRLAAGPSAAPHRPGASELRVERGAVTERTVVRAAADGARLVVGRKAVLTPLARDKARVLGVEIQKER